jgi:hypothetical protein
MDRVEIQVQDLDDNWRTITILTCNLAQVILNAMRDAKMKFPDRRVRATDEHGRLLDMIA